MSKVQLIHEELSYQIIGILYEVYNKLGSNLQEKYYHSRGDIQQILAYLSKSGIELGILANFSYDGVKFKRILRGFNKGQSEKSGYPSPTYSDIREDLNQ